MNTVLNVSSEPDIEDPLMNSFFNEPIIKKEGIMLSTLKAVKQ